MSFSSCHDKVCYEWPVDSVNRNLDDHGAPMIMIEGEWVNVVQHKNLVANACFVVLSVAERVWNSHCVTSRYKVDSMCPTVSASTKDMHSRHEEHHDHDHDLSATITTSVGCVMGDAALFMADTVPQFVPDEISISVLDTVFEETVCELDLQDNVTVTSRHFECGYEVQLDELNHMRQCSNQYAVLRVCPLPLGLAITVKIYSAVDPSLACLENDFECARLCGTLVKQSSSVSPTPTSKPRQNTKPDTSRSLAPAQFWGVQIKAPHDTEPSRFLDHPKVTRFDYGRQRTYADTHETRMKRVTWYRDHGYAIE
jgi:hypothetical protein